MAYTVDKTKFRHRLWGEGILRGTEGTALIIEFPQQGVKKLSATCLNSGILSLVDEESSLSTAGEQSVSGQDAEVFSLNNAGPLQQYDSAEIVLGGKNILEAFDSSGVAIFNESYTIIGEETTAKKISATYDLTVIGNLTVDEIHVNGDLTIIGNITAQKLICANSFVCRGNANIQDISVGSIVAKNVKCDKFVCDGNALIETTIDINESSRTEKTMVAGEGIVGDGNFAALNAIACEYFEFFGDIEGKVLELDSDTTLSELTAPTLDTNKIDWSEMPIDESISHFCSRLQEEYERCNTFAEEHLTDFMRALSGSSLAKVGDYANVFEALLQMSYQDEIDDFGDYLYVVWAKKVLPESVYKYETIEHIDYLLLPKAERILEELEFKPTSVGHVARCVRIALDYSDDIPMALDAVLDKIFSSIGLRYATVKNILNKAYVPTSKGAETKPTVTTADKAPVVPIPAPTVVTGQKEKDGDTLMPYIPAPDVAVRPKPADDDATDMFEAEGTKRKKTKMTKRQFLASPISREGRFFGITAEEQMRLASARVKTCGEFLMMSEDSFRDLFKKKLFLANHLYLAQQKMRAAVEEMDDE